MESVKQENRLQERKPAGIVFDFNGTLIDDLAQQKIAWDTVDQIAGIKKEDYQRLAGEEGLCNMDRLQALLPEASQDELLALSRKKEEIYRDLLLQDRVVLRDGANELFAFLKEHNIPFTIASASIKENIDFFVEHYLKEWVNPELIVFDDGSYSDKADMYRQAARNLNLAAEEIVIVEDSNAGYSGALRAHPKRVFLIMHEQNARLQKDVPEENLISDLSELKKNLISLI